MRFGELAIRALIRGRGEAPLTEIERATSPIKMDVHRRLWELVRDGTIEIAQGPEGPVYRPASKRETPASQTRVVLADESIRDLLSDLLAEALDGGKQTRTEAEQFLSVRAAAEAVDAHPASVRRWIREGRLPEHRAGRHLRVRRADLEALLQRGRRPVETLTPEQRAARDFG